MKKYHIIILVLLCVSATVFGQPSDLVKSDGVTYPIHQANIGKIAFMRKVVPIELFTQADFLTNVEFNEKSDFNIRAFLGNSLTNYLHLLAPSLTADELIKNGNYQFTFWVDNQKIYVENLNVGAGSTDSKTQKTFFRVPLISSTNEDSWGRFLWNRFYGNGGSDALSEGEHLLKIEIRPYLKLTEVITGNVIAEGQIKITVPAIKIDEKLIKVQKIKPLKDFNISKSKIDTAKIEALNRKIATQNFKRITSIIVLKEGELLLEEYFNGASRKTLHDTRSVGKSFASTLLGIAINDNFIKSENQTLNQFYKLTTFQNYSATKDSVTLKDLLTMSAAFDGSDMDAESQGNEENMYPTKNWVQFALNLPIDQSKVTNKRWDYFTAGVVVLGDVIHQSVPNGLEKYSKEKLFRPLGITKYKWQFTPQKVANTAGGLQLRSLDYAKYGQLYQNKGVWNGKQILPKEWVYKTFSHQIKLSEEEYYGYLFWNKIYHVNGTNYEVYYSSGNGGNKIFIFKDFPIVIVITSTAYNTPYGHKQVEKIMKNYLIDAVIH
ncbi:CubicO group peptidase, beta-lactamase class C family [Flexibacter flexilis DSM 6793]|uniref:CubicO group peptidase, beta-lactamase class C family n=1 Tax=Flexibacter flexilis DSM 6793 TaxID=927664 RepID=A0A1I1IBL0_9BACT|nr:serine hydrolase [Flexibacter flexilis]SFC30680.1 CubicO group peptidase, beta-lactamase class C family [Flexibacter flexilis DSM 6793]